MQKRTLRTTRLQMAELKIFDSADELSQYFADFLREDLNHKKGKYSLALSGGSTPKQVFNFIAEKYKPPIQWERIDIYWGDERCVLPDDPESNYKMADDYLLSKIPLPGQNIYRIRGEDNPETEAERYSGVIKNNLTEKPVFDLIMLGLGEDGHTASIFPDQMNLLTDKSICSTAIHPDSGQKRITLTGTTINIRPQYNLYNNRRK
jgi:6-phosphogluconolactonase